MLARRAHPTNGNVIAQNALTVATCNHLHCHVGIVLDNASASIITISFHCSPHRNFKDDRKSFNARYKKKVIYESS